MNCFLIPLGTAANAVLHKCIWFSSGASRSNFITDVLGLLLRNAACKEYFEVLIKKR